MSALDPFGGSIGLSTAELDTDALVGAFRTPNVLMVNLTSTEWIGERLGGFERVILRYAGREHEYTPEEVLAALRAQRGKLAKARPVIVSDGETDYATGYCRCGACGRPTDPWDAWCRWCGQRQDETRWARGD